jgi:hypothetical protein
MANHIYPAYTQDVLNGDTPWVRGAIYAALLSPAAVYNAANTIFGQLSANQVGGTVKLANAAVSAAGVASAGSVTFSGVSAGLTVAAMVLFIDPGAGGAQRLIAWWDTVVGMPLTTTGADITIDWNGTTPTGTVITAVGP